MNGMPVQTNFQSAKRIRRMGKGNTGRIRGGKLYPIMMHMIRGSESGVLDQTITLELDPIPGRLISEAWLEAFDIFVPLQAMDAIKDPGAAYAGMTEVVREKLLSGTPVLGLENEGTISQTAKVNPRSIAGAKKVNECVRLAYNCAVNMLRQRAYFRASLVLHSNTAILPAIYAQTVLDRINGVLDPDDRVNGMVQFETGVITTTAAFPATTADLKRAFLTNTTASGTIDTITGAADSTTTFDNIVAKRASNTAAPNPVPGVDIPAMSLPVNMTGLDIGSVSLQDFYNAQNMDKFARLMDDMMRKNPQYGEEMVLRWAHGLSVDAGRMPFILAERRIPINRTIAGAMDSAGVNDDVMRTDGAVRFGVTVPIPKTELGGVIVTLICLKPDEKLRAQPEPFLSDVWTADNFVADSLALDPQPVTVRDMYSDCASGDEATVLAYTGLNALKEAYVDYGFSRATNLALVDNKTAIWQVDVPLSVNPENVNYPDYIDHGVFAYGGTEASPTDVATFSIQSTQNSPTPMIVGPTPVEDIGINNDNLFEEA